MVTQINKQTFYPDSVGAVSNRTGVECLINSKVYHKTSITGTLNFSITQATLAGIRREGTDRGRGQVDGLIWQDIERVCVYAETEGTLADLRDALMIRLMSDCLLRISEVVVVNIGDLKEKMLMLQTSKTGQEGTGESLYVCEVTRHVLQQYRERAGITRGALFRHIRRGNNI